MTPSTVTPDRIEVAMRRARRLRSEAFHRFLKRVFAYPGRRAAMVPRPAVSAR